MRDNQQTAITLLYQDMLDDFIEVRENFRKGLITAQEEDYLIKKIDNKYHEIFTLIYKL